LHRCLPRADNFPPIAFETRNVPSTTNPMGLKGAGEAGTIGLKADGDAHATAVMPPIREAQAAGAKSLRQIAAALNGRGIATARGGKWEAATVRNILRRSS
jgi:hypothetical protein